MKLKKIIPSVACFILAFATSASAEIKVKVNERTIAMDTSPYIQKNHTLVPVRSVAEILGCDVEWDPNNRSVRIEDSQTEISLTVDRSYAKVDGKEIGLDMPATIKNNRTYVPLRFIAEGLGAEVEWSAHDKTVQITKDGAELMLPYAEDELFWLARIIHAEAQGEPFGGKVAVGNVILNRVEHLEFPNTIYGVIFDRKNGTQFTPVANGQIYNSPSNECFYAADRALSGETIIGEALYFCNPVTSTNSWIINNRPLHSKIGKHNFYL